MEIDAWKQQGNPDHEIHEDCMFCGNPTDKGKFCSEYCKKGYKSEN